MYQKCFNTFVYWGLGCLVFNQGGIREQGTKKKLASRNHICKTINNLIWKVNSDLKSVHSFCFFVSVCTVCIFFSKLPAALLRIGCIEDISFLPPNKQKSCNGPFYERKKGIQKRSFKISVGETKIHKPPWVTVVLPKDFFFCRPSSRLQSQDWQASNSAFCIFEPPVPFAFSPCLLLLWSPILEKKN